MLGFACCPFRPMIVPLTDLGHRPFQRGCARNSRTRAGCTSSDGSAEEPTAIPGFNSDKYCQQDADVHSNETMQHAMQQVLRSHMLLLLAVQVETNPEGCITVSKFYGNCFASR